MSSPDAKGRWPRLLAFAALIAALVVAWQLGVFDDLSVASLSDWVRGLGAWGPVVFIVAFVLGELVAIPSVMWVVIAGLVWPLHIALPVAFAGAMAANAVVFLVARYLVSGRLRSWITAKLPADLKRYDQALVDHGIRTVAIIRLLTFMAPVMHWVLATSRVRFRDMLIGSAIGIIPGVTALVVGGEQAMAHWQAHRWWILGGVGLLIAARVAYRWWRGRRQRPADEPKNMGQTPTAE